MRKRLFRFLEKTLVFYLILTWVFSSSFPLFNFNLQPLQETKTAEAAVTSYTQASTIVNDGCTLPSGGNYTDNNPPTTLATHLYQCDSDASPNLEDNVILGGYNFGIPAGATITGIVVHLNDVSLTSSGAGTQSFNVRLSPDGGTTWTAAAQNDSDVCTTPDITSTALNGEEYYCSTNASTAGTTDPSSGGLWGRTWTASELSSSNFKVHVIADNTSNTARVQRFDVAEVKVYYTVPPSISSAANQSFAAGQGTTAISTITITDNEPSITATNDIRVKLPTGMTWDTSDTSATLGGTASAKVSSTVTYEDSGQTLVLNVTSDFTAGNTLTVSGLSFKNFTAGLSNNIKLYDDGAGDVSVDAIDDKTLVVYGAVTLADHAAGQTTNKFVQGQTSTTTIFHQFKITNTGEAASTTLTFDLSSISGVSASDFSNTAVYIDSDGDGIIATSTPWANAYDTPETSITSMIVDQVNNVMYAGSNGGGIIYRCELSTNCDASSDWTVSYDTAEPTITDFAIDTSRNVLYASTIDGAIVFRCELSTNCDASGDWTSTLDSSLTALYSVEYFPALDVLYAGANDNNMRKCSIASSNCDASADWSSYTLSASASSVRSMVVDTTNGVLYAGTGAAGFIFRCLQATLCDGSGDWTTSYDTPSSYINALTIDTTNNVLYATADNDTIYRCAISTDCDAAGDWTVAYTNVAGASINSITVNSSQGKIFAGRASSPSVIVCTISSGCDETSDWSTSLSTNVQVDSLYSTSNGSTYAGSASSGMINYLAAGTDPSFSSPTISIVGSSGTISFTSTSTLPSGANNYVLYSTISNITGGDAVTINVSASKIFATGQSSNRSLSVSGSATSITHVLDAASLSSAANQTFTVGSSATAISTITFTDAVTPLTTATSDLRIAIATSTIGMLWDTTDTSVVLGGTAASKVSSTVSYEGGGSVLVLNVTSNFSSADTLTISGLSFTNFTAAHTPVAGILRVFAGGAGDTSYEAADDKTVAITGSQTLADHALGQVENKFESQTTATTTIFHRFKLTTSGETASTTLTFDLSNISGILTADITNANLYYDLNGDGLITPASAATISYDGTDTYMHTIVVDQVHNVMYAGGENEAAFYRCDLSTNCDASSDWTTSYDIGTGGIYNMAIDTTNSWIYAVAWRADGNYVYKCATSSNCDSGGDWLGVWSSTTESLNQIVYEATNNAWYFTTYPEGKIYRCLVSPGCTSDSNWTMVYDTSATSIYGMTVDTINNVLYVGGGQGTSGTNVVYRCVLSTGCDASGDFTTSTVNGLADYYTNAMIFDPSNGVIYHSTAIGGIIYRCAVSTNCDAAGDWTTSYDTPMETINDFAIDTTNGFLYAVGTNNIATGNVYQCTLASGCDSASDWSLIWTSPTDLSSENRVMSIAVDTVNNTIYFGTDQNGYIVRKVNDQDKQVYTPTSASVSWSTSYDTAESGINSLAYDSVNGVMYAGTISGGIIYRCPVSTGCDASGDWAVSNDTSATGIWSLKIDTTNNILYAGSGSGGIIFRCDLSTSCDASGDWTTSYDSPATTVYSITFDNTNGVLYAATGASGIIYRCAVSTNCDAAGDWSTSHDSTSANVEAVIYDPTSAALYAGVTNDDIYQCLVSTGCDATGEWTLVYNGIQSWIHTMTIDTTNGVIYVGSGDNANIYRCVLSTGCDASGEWSNAVSLFFPATNIWSLTYDPVHAMLYAGTDAGTVYGCDTTTGCDASADWSISMAFDGVSAYVNSLAVDTTNGVVYAGTESGGTIQRGEYQVAGGAGTVNISGGSGALTFSGTTTLPMGTRNYLLQATISNITGDDTVTFGLNPSKIIAYGNSTLTKLTVSGSATDITHTLALPISISGTLFSDFGLTADTTGGRTIALKINGTGNYSTTTISGTGVWSISNISGVKAGLPILAWVDNDPTFTAATITKASSTLNITGLDLYKSRLISKHEGTSGTSTTAANLALYDADDDSSIPFTANSSSVTVKSGMETFVWPSTSFNSGTLTLHGNASAYPDGDLILGTSSSWTGGLSNTINGNFYAASSSSLSVGALFFRATTTAKTISVPSTLSFPQITFGGVGTGGGYTFLTAATTSSFTISSGATVVAPASTFTMQGPFTNSGTFIHNSGTVIFSAPTVIQNIGGTLVGTSAFNNIVFRGGAAKTFTANASTTDFTIENTTGVVSLSAGGLTTIAGNYLNTTMGTAFNNAGSTVYIDGASPQIFDGGSNFKNLIIKNTSGSDPELSPSVTFKNGITATGTLSILQGGTKIVFKSGATTTIGTLALNGQSAGNPIFLSSSVPGTKWGISITGSASISYTSVKDSNACPGSVDASNGTNINRGNNSCWSFGVIPTISLPNDVTFIYNSIPTSLATLTVTDDVSSSTITTAKSIRLGIATSTLPLLWDTSRGTLSISGSAASKVSSSVTYEGGGSVMVIPVTSNFSAGDTISISNAYVTNFATVTPALPNIITLLTDGASDIVPNAYVSNNIGVRGTLTVSQATIGQTSNKLDTQVSSLSASPLYLFKLIPLGENTTIPGATFALSNVNGFSSSDFANAKLYIDYNSNGTVDAGDTQVGGSGVVSITGSEGTVTFSSSFTATTTRDYILISDINNITNYKEFTLSLNPISSNGVISLVVVPSTGRVYHIHRRVTSFIGGGIDIGGSAPQGQTPQTGGGASGGGGNTSGGGGNQTGGGTGGGGAI